VKPTRRTVLHASAAPFVFTRPAQPAQKRPNFLFIFTDDQRYDAIRGLGHQLWLRTPNLDRLLAQGANFRNAFVTTSLCSPSRSSFLTGCYAHTTGVLDNRRDSYIRPEVPRVLPLLSQAGYQTAYVGKVHIPNIESALQGAGHVASFPGQGSYFNNQFIVNGKATPTEGYITDHINRFALEFLRARDKGKPFAMFVGHKAVHSPFEPDPKHRDLFREEWMPLPKTWDDRYEGRPSYLKTRRKSWHGLEGLLEKYHYSSWERQIAACLVSVDDGVGRLMAELEKSGELEDTIIVYSSDNGFFHGQHGLHDKRAMYEDSIRVPHLVHYPRRIRPGTVYSQMVLNIDLAPTMLDFAGADIPRQMQGRSWRPIIEERDSPGRESWLYEYNWEKSYPFDPTQYGIRTRRYKYIRYPDTGNMDPEYPMKGELPYDELYDLENDPLEMRNIAADPAAAQVLERLRDTLKRTLEQTGYPGGYR
jgi:N-acetylglucosamine-6-sulfatase